MDSDLAWESYQSQILGLAALDYNYDEKIYLNSEDHKDWFIDKYEATLAHEAPGPPGKAFAAAKNALLLYRFTDRRLISVVFDPSIPLPGRNMLMFAKFLGFTFRFGVRVTKVIDESRNSPSGQAETVWGYSYRTLKGHFEIGEIQFELLKHLTSGEVHFRISAYSKPDVIPNFFYRVGFKIFGRVLQKYFAHSSIKRLREIARASKAS